MTHKKFSILLWFVFVFILMGAVMLALPAAPSQAQATLPPRGTLTPTPPSADDDKDDPPPGAYIELQVQGASAGVWTAVQWQDSNGDWQNVEGWQGTLDGGDKRWWVAPKDFGTGPFRWAVTQGRGGALVGVSQAFDLPNEANAVTRVMVSAGQ